MLIHLCMLWNHQFGAKYGPRSPPQAIYEPGGQGVTETPIVSKGLGNFPPLIQITRHPFMNFWNPTSYFIHFYLFHYYSLSYLSFLQFFLFICLFKALLFTSKCFFSSSIACFDTFNFFKWFNSFVFWLIFFWIKLFWF